MHWVIFWKVDDLLWIPNVPYGIWNLNEIIQNAL